MGTLYHLCGALEFTPATLDAWLASEIGPVYPWARAGTPVRALVERLARGDEFANGTPIAPLPVAIARDGARARVRWIWRTIASEVAPEVRAVSWALFSSARTHATRGVCAHRDELGPEALWDRAEVLAHGVTVPIADWFEVLFANTTDGACRARAHDEDDDPPF